MASIARTQNCCGVRELYNLGGPSRDIIKQVCEAINGTLNAAFYMFADNTESTNGTKLAAYITKHKLGKLIKTPAVFNPQSQHMLEVWLWELDQEAINDYVEALS